MSHTRLLIAALSCAGYNDRRRACRETWANIGQRDDVDLVFVVGGGAGKEPYRRQDMLVCPCPDDYHSLSIKVKALCHWATTHCSFDYLFKCDDDTYVHVDRLLNYEFADHYVGAPIPGRRGFYHPSGGAGYRLSRMAASIIGTTPVAAVSYEDWMVWNVLRHRAVHLRSDARFTYDCELRPTKENEQITCHQCRPDVILEIHQSLISP